MLCILNVSLGELSAPNLRRLFDHSVEDKFKPHFFFKLLLFAIIPVKSIVLTSIKLLLVK